MSNVHSVLIAGLGGQGVITVATLLTNAAWRAGYDVKRSEIHGMSQRGGSVTSDVRFGTTVMSPMIPIGCADYLLVLDQSQCERVTPWVRSTGVIVTPDVIDASQLRNRRTLNVALLAALSTHLPITDSVWQSTLPAVLPARILDVNLEAWALGRAVGTQPRTP
jgi:indolepyruvate ferredoxin oxidoreductase beta subunit